jgi:hypothetical protein
MATMTDTPGLVVHGVCCWCDEPVRVTPFSGRIVTTGDASDTADWCAGAPDHTHGWPGPVPGPAERCARIRAMIAGHGWTETVERIGSMRVALAMQAHGLTPPPPLDFSEPCGCGPGEVSQ